MIFCALFSFIFIEFDFLKFSCFRSIFWGHYWTSSLTTMTGILTVSPRMFAIVIGDFCGALRVQRAETFGTTFRSIRRPAHLVVLSLTSLSVCVSDLRRKDRVLGREEKEERLKGRKKEVFSVSQNRRWDFLLFQKGKNKTYLSLFLLFSLFRSFALFVNEPLVFSVSCTSVEVSVSFSFFSFFAKSVGCWLGFEINSFLIFHSFHSSFSFSFSFISFYSWMIAWCSIFHWVGSWFFSFLSFHF